MKTPVQRLGWAGVFVLAGMAVARADGVCTLSETDLCAKLDPSVRFVCAKNVLLAAASCRKAAGKLRFGSHEKHCRTACKAGAQAFDLDDKLRALALTTVEKSSTGDAAWLAGARTFWRVQGKAAVVCTQAQFNQARTDCDAYCDTKARRRDLEELQALAAGKEFLDLHQPVFACPPGPATELLSDGDVLEHLYPPYHPSRSGTAAE